MPTPLTGMATQTPTLLHPSLPLRKGRPLQLLVTGMRDSPASKSSLCSSVSKKKRLGRIYISSSRFSIHNIVYAHSPCIGARSILIPRPHPPLGTRLKESTVLCRPFILVVGREKMNSLIALYCRCYLASFTPIDTTMFTHDYVIHSSVNMYLHTNQFHTYHTTKWFTPTGDICSGWLCQWEPWTTVCGESTRKTLHTVRRHVQGHTPGVHPLPWFRPHEQLPQICQGEGIQWEVYITYGACDSCNSITKTTPQFSRCGLGMT